MGVLRWNRSASGSGADAAEIERLRLETARLTRDEAVNNEILERMSEGVLVVDERLVPIVANRAARQLLGLPEDALRPDFLGDALTSLARGVVVERHDVIEVVDLPNTDRTTVRVSGSYLEGQGGAVLVLHDVSDEQRAQRIRRQFVTHASHELKTPIASIRALSEAVAEASTDDPARARQFAEKVVQEAERLSRVVGDLLDLSRVEDPATISNAVADLSQVVEREVEDVRRLAEAKHISVTATLAPEVLVKGDAEQLGLMVRNLLENAIRYTQEAGAVAVALRAGAEAELTIADNGIGIPLRHQSRVFERFYRVDKGRSRDEGGTGLGLAIVKHVADLHGGRVELKSEFGEGSTFIVRMPSLGASASGSTPARDPA